jgi:hypothetical protein
MEVSGQLHSPAALPLWKEPSYALHRKLGEAKSRSGLCGVRTISCPCRELNASRQTRSPFKAMTRNLRLWAFLMNSTYSAIYGNFVFKCVTELCTYCFTGSIYLYICLSVCLSMALQSFVWPWTLFQFLNPLHSRQDSLAGGSARHKAATYTQHNTNRINAHRHPCLEWDSNPWSQCSSGRR